MKDKMTILTITKEERNWIDNLLDIVEEAIESWRFYPEDEYGTSEAIIPTGIMVRMQEAYEKYDTLEKTSMRALEKGIKEKEHVKRILGSMPVQKG
jgi:hypothetical protein